MKLKCGYILIAIALVVTRPASAQNKSPQNDTSIKGATIEIIQSYKPEVKQIPKPELTPGLPPADTTQPVFNYTVPQQLLYYNYSSLPLRPLALGKDTTRMPFSNYVKIGAGNLSTLYLDAGIGGLRGKGYETAIAVHSISQKGNVLYQQTSLSDIAADGTLHRNGNAWHASLDGVRNQYYYYGYNSDPAYIHNNADSLKQVFTGARLNIDMQNESHGLGQLNYHPVITASLYQDKFNTSENTIGFNIPVSYSVDTSLQFELGLKGIFTQLKTLNQNTANNVVQLNPGILFHNDVFKGRAFFNVASGQGGTLYFLPDIEADYTIPNSYYTISAGWQSLLKRNTFEELTTENPYLFDLYQTRQTQRSEVFGEIRGNVGRHITFSGRVSWWEYSNLPLFVNDSGDQKQFRVIYEDNLNATSLQGNAKYQVSNAFAVGLNAAFYGYYNGQFDHVWNEPSMRLKGNLLFRPLNELTITAYLAILDGIYALSRNDNEVKLSPVMDLGGNIEYEVISRLSVFLQVNNLLNNKYERWLGYQAYGFNVYGGLRVKF